MPLMPKRVMYRKTQRGRVRGNATRGNTVSYGEFGLQSLEAGWTVDNSLNGDWIPHLFTYYTTNGSTPTTSSTIYTASFAVSTTTTVKFFSLDNAGNAEGVKSQTIPVDTVAPTTTISCNMPNVRDAHANPIIGFGQSTVKGRVCCRVRPTP